MPISARESAVEPRLDAPAQSMPAPATPSPAVATAPTLSTPEKAEAPGMDQIARIEEKAARIEEKFARTEALMQRVETAATGLSDVARRSDVDALRERVERLPGFAALVVTAIIASVLTAALTIAVIRFLPAIAAI